MFIVSQHSFGQRGIYYKYIHPQFDRNLNVYDDADTADAVEQLFKLNEERKKQLKKKEEELEKYRLEAYIGAIYD